MKKIIYLITSLTLCFILIGCDIGKDMTNNPTKKVETMFSNYQTLNEDVLKDLDNVLAYQPSFTTEQRQRYRNLMKKHYQDLTYEIKDERIDGDNAIVTVEIEVKDYTKEKANADLYLNNNQNKFLDEKGEYSETLFNDYLLEKYEQTSSKVKYTLDLGLTKQNDEWKLNELTSDDYKKIQGMYTE